MLKTDETENYRELWLSVIQRAVRDAYWRRYATNKLGEFIIAEQKKDALEWLNSTSCRVGSLNWILDLLEIDRDLKWRIFKRYKRRHNNDEGIRPGEQALYIQGNQDEIPS